MIHMFWRKLSLFVGVSYGWRMNDVAGVNIVHCTECHSRRKSITASLQLIDV
jgi:hypothetical protein